MRSIACLLVDDVELAGTWLGHKPILHHVLDTLRDIRSIERIVLFSHDPAGCKTLTDNQLTVVGIVVPTPELPLGFIFSHCQIHAPEIEAFLYVNPYAPFLTANSIERGLDLLVSMDSVITVRRGTTVRKSPKGPVFADDHVLVNCFRGIMNRPDFPLETTNAFLAPEFERLTLDSIESLDVSNPQELTLATAVLETSCH